MVLQGIPQRYVGVKRTRQSFKKPAAARKPHGISNLEGIPGLLLYYVVIFFIRFMLNRMIVLLSHHETVGPC